MIMRISGYGTGSGGQGSSRDRRKAFRRDHSVGQRVVGAFIGWHDEKLAWVEIDGQQLLAQLDADPHPGQRFLFVIKQLDPDIMLQVLQPGGAGAMVLAGMVHEFWGVRVRFELKAQSLSPALFKEQDLARRKRLFVTLLQEQPEAAQAFQGMVTAQRQINSWLQAQRQGQLLVAPWLLPGARDFELLVRSGKGGTGGLRELTASFALAALGHCELRMLLRPPKARYRILLERPTKAPQVQACLKGLRVGGLGLELEAGGVGALPPGPRTVLAAFLYEESQSFLPRFSTHV